MVEIQMVEIQVVEEYSVSFQQQLELGYVELKDLYCLQLEQWAVDVVT